MIQNDRIRPRSRKQETARKNPRNRYSRKPHSYKKNIVIYPLCSRKIYETVFFALTRLKPLFFFTIKKHMILNYNMIKILALEAYQKRQISKKHSIVHCPSFPDVDSFWSKGPNSAIFLLLFGMCGISSFSCIPSVKVSEKYICIIPRFFRNLRVNK